MMNSKCSFSWAIAAGIALTGLAPPARADFQVMFSYDGASITVDVTTQTVTTAGGAVFSPASVTYNSANQVTITNLTIDPNGGTDNNSGGFNVSASISKTNSPGSPTVGTITTSGLDIITNQSGVGGYSTLSIATASTGFTQPLTNPVVLKSTASVTTDGANSQNASMVLNSYLNTDNSQWGTGNPGFGAPVVDLNPIAPGASASDNKSGLGNPGATPYSLVQVAQFTLANGDEFFDGSTGTSVMATPAPGGLLLALTGMPVIGFGAWVRRWRLAAKA